MGQVRTGVWILPLVGLGASGYLGYQEVTAGLAINRAMQAQGWAAHVAARTASPA